MIPTSPARRTWVPQQAQQSAPGKATIRPGKGHDPHLAGEHLLAAVVQPGQRIRRGEGDLHRGVLPDHLVGGLFRGHDLFPGQLGIVVDGHRVRPQVEAHIVTAVQRAQQAGENVLPGVLLHVVEPAGPVDGSLHFGADLHRAVTGVENHAVCFMDIRDLDCAHGAVVRRLSAPLRVEGGAVQHYGPAGFGFFTGEHPGGEGGEIGVLVIEFFRFHVENFLSFRGWDRDVCHSSPRFCFQVSTRRQAVSMVSPDRAPLSSASRTLGIWVR